MSCWNGNERDTKTLDAPTLEVGKNRTISKIVNSKGNDFTNNVNEEKYVVYVDKDGKGRKGRKIVKSAYLKWVQKDYITN